MYCVPCGIMGIRLGMMRNELNSKDINYLQLDQLFDVLNPVDDLQLLFERIRREDLGEHNVDLTTSAMIDRNRQSTAELVARETGVVAGLRAVPAMIEAYFGQGKRAKLEWMPLVEDGFTVNPGEVLARLSGSLTRILIIERPILNLLGRMSGIATITRKYVKEIKGSPACIFDTRKTTPGLRGLEKYAVRCGGGRCHRLGLYDAVLVKDNHIGHITDEALTEELTKRLAPLRRKRVNRPQFIEVEVDTIEQLEAVLACPSGLVDIVLLDNMSIEGLCEAAAMRDRMQPDVELEASGGVNLGSVRSIAITGMDRISVGAITHSAASLDLGLDISDDGEGHLKI